MGWNDLDENDQFIIKWVGCLCGVVILLALICIVVNALVDGPETSRGFRDGVVQKAAVSGIFVKTNEAQLAMGGLKLKGDEGGNYFDFSVPDIIVWNELQKVPPGSNVRIQYIHRLWMSWWTGKSGYTATKVEVLGKIE